MLDKETLKELVHDPKLDGLGKLLICMAYTSDEPQSVINLKSIGRSVGLESAFLASISNKLSILSSNYYVIRLPEGWELTKLGKERVAALSGIPIDEPARKVATTLRDCLAAITNPDTSQFLEEAIKCCELKLYRAAVVLSWVGAMAVLYDYVLKNKLKEFNAEAVQRNSKWKDAKTTDDLSTIREHEFLQMLAAISVIGKNVKQELEARLKLRNGCGHPNSFAVGESGVAYHIEMLVLNIFSKF